MARARKHIVQYGYEFDPYMHPVAIELFMCRIGGGKEGLFFHYKKGMQLLWPEIKWWKGCDLFLEAYLNHRTIAVMGPASLGKTFFSSALAVWDYFVDENHTKILICSTTVERMRDRIWGQVVKFHTTARRECPWLPGHVVSGRMRLLTNERLDSDNPEDCGTGVVGIAVQKGETCAGLASFSGLKSDRLRLFGDEIQFLPMAFIFAISGLDKNKNFKLVGLGNPQNTMDPLGTLAEPAPDLGGWDGGIDQQGDSKIWRTRRPQGCTLQLVGSDSPNLDGNFGANMLDQASIDRDVAMYGKNSLQFSMLNDGRMPHGLGSKRVITRQECLQHHATEEPRWLTSEQTHVVSLDAAYGGVGGDRCILTHTKFGRQAQPMIAAVNLSSPLAHELESAATNRQIMAVETSMVVPVTAFAKEPPPDQIVRFCMTYCKERGIPPQNFFYDSGMRVALVQRFGELWPGTNAIDCGGKPTDRPVSADREVKCCEYYSKFVTELWFNVRWVIISGQMRLLPEDEMIELASREWCLVAGNKTEVESKDKMKQKFGRSPDKADALSLACWGAIKLGFVIRRLNRANTIPKDDAWKKTLRERASNLWKGAALVEDAA